MSGKTRSFLYSNNVICPFFPTLTVGLRIWFSSIHFCCIERLSPQIILLLAIARAHRREKSFASWKCSTNISTSRRRAIAQLSGNNSIPTILLNAFSPSFSVLQYFNFRAYISTRNAPSPQAGSRNVLSMFCQISCGIKSHMALTSRSFVKTSPNFCVLSLLFTCLLTMFLYLLIPKRIYHLLSHGNQTRQENKLDRAEHDLPKVHVRYLYTVSHAKTLYHDR